MNQMIVFLFKVVLRSEKIWVSSCGAVLDDARSEFRIIRIISVSAPTIFMISCMRLGLNKGSKSIESDFSKNMWINRSGAISAAECRKTDSIRIFGRTASRILLISEI